MSGIQPVAVYAMRVPPGDIMVPAVPEFAAMFRLTMAAIDPSAEPELEDADDTRPRRATLKVIRVPDSLLDDSDDDSEDDDYLDGLEDDDDESDEDEDEDEVNGGPSERKSKKQALLDALAADMEEDEHEHEKDAMDDDEAADAKAADQLKQILQDAKGKSKAVDGEDDDSDLDSSDDEAVELDEVVVCTLDPEKHYQQALDFVVGEGEKVFFKVSGTHTVHLTGNYLIPQDDGQASLFDEDEDDEDDELDYDLSPDEDELDLLQLVGEESDDLDDLEDPHVMEVDSDDGNVAKAATAATARGKGKNKRPAEDSDQGEDGEGADKASASLDDIMAKSLKKDAEAAAPLAGEPAKKLSKAEKKRLKKLKNNDGQAVPATTAADGKKDSAQSNGSVEKKVQFAKNLEQGPTPSGAATKSEKAATPGVKTVQGVSVDDRKVGTGPAAKKGSRLEMRYIGKLDDGKVFDSNKSGKPFSFKLGAGEVISGWDIGLAGIQVGGERRLVIPAHLAYGNKSLPGIPKNSRLTFDIKCLGVK